MKETSNINLYSKILLALVFCSMIVVSSCRQKPEMEAKSSEPPALSDDSNLDWFKEAKFGLFIHWGPYARLAGEWNGIQQQEEQSEWIMKYLRIPVEKYREESAKFNPVKFDAKEWVRLAKATGMKYIVITAKHHDGFAMYDSKVSDYNIVKWSPFGRDPLKELAEACKEEGLRFCVYYSHREDWDHPGAYGNDWDFDNDWGEFLYDQEKFEKYLEEKAKPQLKELLTNYGPLGLVWFDRGMYTREQGLEFTKIVHDMQPSCLVNSRVGSVFYSFESLGDYQTANDKGMPRRRDPNKTFPPGGLGDYWEAPQTLNESWGYNKFDNNWKSPDEVIKSLVEIVSRGGNFLLNIGPDGEGLIPAATVDIFNKVGPWVSRNAESIYGTTANLFPPIPWGFTSNKGKNIFLYVRDWPKDGILRLDGLRNKVNSATILADKSNLTFSQDGNRLMINVPKEAPDSPVSVIILTIEGEPSVEAPILTDTDSGKFTLNYLTAVPHGKTKTRFNVQLLFHIAKWESPEDSVDWIIKVTRPGTYKVLIAYAADPKADRKPFRISNGSSAINLSMLSAGDYSFHEFPAGYFNFPSAGEYTISFKPASQGDNLVYLRDITLIPAGTVKKGGWGVN